MVKAFRSIGTVCENLGAKWFGLGRKVLVVGRGFPKFHLGAIAPNKHARLFDRVLSRFGVHRIFPPAVKTDSHAVEAKQRVVLHVFILPVLEPHKTRF